ncbi:MAG: M48 family metalloprotease [Steroidobacteraceae bacterium]
MRALLVLALVACSTFAAAQTAPIELPDIGSAAEASLPKSDEYRIGLMIVRGLRDQGQVLDDPEVADYLQSIGARLGAQTGASDQNFRFFVVRDPKINAFALPGGFIGVNYGLVLATANESQLASVLAHEVAHVTQRHIARSIRAQSHMNLASAAAVLATILIGATTGASSDVLQGAVAVAQGTAAQRQINFTRANEYEADRVGIGFLAGAGFDPQAMPDLFETLGRRTGLQEAQVPEFFQTHPVSANRIAESRARAARYERPQRPDSLSYELARERLRVVGPGSDANALPYYQARPADASLSTGERYGEALALMKSGDYRRAAEILRELVAKNQGATMLYATLGEALMASGDTRAGLAHFAQAMNLFPRNVPLAVRYAEALMQSGRAKRAHELLLDLFNNEAPTPEQIRLIALAASAAGDTGDAYFYMSEYHIGSGDLRLATQQLELALAAPNLTPVQRKRYSARLQEIRDFLTEEGRRGRQDRGRAGDGTDKRSAQTDTIPR